ncbi:MFS general substrate transporter [Dacryopinax primogenitus]|uniref:MFS general substrate transporter n=1 Tax=Dacryopinax primogenitus (strain DJM 731) TaxID=1858805 RepID=M5FZQ7_DACPD|nr:MFS general substrate transporter [Dacryopinax primogenitus]EJU03506.1 MFS general substrate transporter [Dacryopinax primogenitus]
MPITDEERKAHYSLNRKFDLYVCAHLSKCRIHVADQEAQIIPFLAAIYLFNGLDRSNLGNAQTDNFSTDIGIPAAAVNQANSLFFVTYIPFHPIIVGFGKKMGQTKFIALIGSIWGILTICHAFVKGNGSLIAIRLLMGAAECGFYPTAVSYLSNFYPRYDLAFRFSLFYSFFAIAGAFGGLIAFGVFQIHGSLYGWQYLFIIEGIVPIILAIAAPFMLAKGPGTAWYLTPQEREYADKRMVMDAAANLDSTYKLTKRDIYEACIDWRLWVTLAANIMSTLAGQGLSTFFPVVIKGLGYSGALANLMTVPPYVAGSVVLLLVAYSSDRFKNRTFHILGGLVLVIIGLALTLSLPLENTGGRYAGLLVLLSGSFISSPLSAVWLAGNTPEPGKRVIIISFNGWGNLSGVIGSELFVPQYGPDYRYPLKITLILVCTSFALYIVVYILLRYTNWLRAKKLATMTADELEEENRSDVRVGDKKYTFVYGL